MKFSEQVKLAKSTKQIHSTWYRETYPEVAELGLDPATHYLRYGAEMGRNPGKSFNTQFYLDTYPEVRKSKLNPLVHYALYGQKAGYATRPQREDPRKQINVIRTKLLSLGFTERPLAELTDIANTSDNPEARAMAARELALWHMRAKTETDYRTALDWIERAHPDVPDTEFRAKLATIEMLCHYHLNDLAEGLAAYDKAALAGAATLDLTLARVNFEPSPENRVLWINQVLTRYDIEPVTLLPDEGQPAYDRLTCAVNLPKVTDGPKVTVLIAAYDAAEMLPTALRSLQEQTWQNLEIIVLDDCSPKSDTVRVAEEFATRDTRIQVVQMEKNGGVYVARKHGLDMATGEFVTIHNPNDWSHPKKIETQVRFLSENTFIPACHMNDIRTNSDLSFIDSSDYPTISEDQSSSYMCRRLTGQDYDSKSASSVSLSISRKGNTEASLIREEGYCDLAVIADMRPSSPDVDHVLKVLLYAVREKKDTVLIQLLNTKRAQSNDIIDKNIKQILDDVDCIRWEESGGEIGARYFLVSNLPDFQPGQIECKLLHKIHPFTGQPRSLLSLQKFASSINVKRIIANKEAANLNLNSIASLCSWLWGGFSEAARDQIEVTLKDNRYKDQDRAKGAYALGRWYAQRGDWSESIRVLSMLSKLNVELFRSKRTKLLYIEGNINLGQFSNASQMIDFVLNQREDADFLCARSNLQLVQAGPNLRAQRAETINAMYKHKNLIPITFFNKSEIRFGKWSCEPGPQDIIEDGPKVSVLMAVYNAQDFIELSVKSMLSQTWRNLEIIAVEDCGSDTSWEKLQRLAALDNRLKIYRNEKNMGAYSTRNRALSLATGDFVTVHDSDDWSHPQMIAIQLRAMQEAPHLKATFSSMTRVYDDMRFMLRPQRKKLEYVHRSYPSLLIKRQDVEVLGEWDNVSANADDEFVQRIRMEWGAESIADVMTDVPLSFFLVHPDSLTQQKGTSLNSLTFGIRQEYSRQANYWRTKKGQSDKILHYERTSMKDPFPIPAGLAPKHWKHNRHYDIILMSDLSLLGGTRRSNEGYIKAAIEMGLRVGLFHWPRFDLKPAKIADEYTELSYDPLVDFIVHEDSISANLLLLHHPPILKYSLDAYPKIKCRKATILVNQSPMQTYGGTPHYYDGPKAEAFFKSQFNVDPIWVPIAPRVSKILESVGGFSRLSSEIWYPPYGTVIPEILPALPSGIGQDRRLVLGRHARDHWTKWPQITEELRSAYCGEATGIQVRLMGGLEIPRKILGTVPSNWIDIPFDSVPVSSFIQELDFFVHFVHSDYIEEFGRNIMEAFAAGRVVLLPHDFEDTFGDAAVYCLPHQVANKIRGIWLQPDAYRDQAERGFAFVHQYCTLLRVKERLNFILQG